MSHGCHQAGFAQIMVADRERTVQALDAAIAESPRAPCMDTQYAAWKEWHLQVCLLAEKKRARLI